MEYQIINRTGKLKVRQLIIIIINFFIYLNFMYSRQWGDESGQVVY